MHDDLWQMLRSDYLRPSKPTFDSSYRRVAGAAKMMGLPIPSSRTLRRRFETEIDPIVVTLCREGIPIAPVGVTTSSKVRRSNCPY